MGGNPPGRLPALNLFKRYSKRKSLYPLRSSRHSRAIQHKRDALSTNCVRWGGSNAASTLGITTETAGSSASQPIALGPQGTTTTDTVAHVRVQEEAQKDVTTTFVGSAVVEKNDDRVTTYSSPNYIRNMTSEFIMTLKKALARPVAVSSGSWATTDAVGTALYDANVPENLLALAIVSRKLDGFQGIRGSITFRLQATANPFQQGRLKLAFYPMYDEDTTAPGRAAAPESWSFWPSVDLDLGCETACELRIPFVMPVSFLDLITATPASRPQMGHLMVKVYGALQTGAGTNTVGWNLYGHWNEDDLELINPTPNSFQSGHTKTLTKKSSLPAEKEQKHTKISDMLEAGAKVADVVSGIPVLAEFAGPTKWALRCGARLASALGFSRPPIDEAPRLVTPYTFPYNANVEGPDVSMPLSLSIKPTLRIEPTLTGKTEDELSIDYFLTKFGYHTTLNLTTSAAAGAVLWNKSLGVFFRTAQEVFYPKPFQTMASLFRYWRGNFRFRFKFVKTKMHTARLMFVFFPGIQANQTLYQAEYAHREIVDLGARDELVYELPFTHKLPYIHTTSSDEHGTYGSFQILVVNPLQAPSSVANNIDIIVEMAMGEGAEFTQPAPAFDSVPQIAQSGQTQGLVKVSTLSDAQLTGPQTDTAQLCVGEKMLSLRQLIRYPANIATSLTKVTPMATAGGDIATPQYFNPFVIGGALSTGLSSVRFRDYLGILAPYFRFSRGSMHVRTIISQVAGGNGSPLGYWTTNVKSADQVGAFGQDTTAAASNIPFGGDFQQGSNQVLKHLLPPWQGVPMVPLKYVLSTTANSSHAQTRQSSLSIRGYGLIGSATYTLTFQRQPADDYELMYFLGPAQLVTATA
jgi:hypothetical protein